MTSKKQNERQDELRDLDMPAQQAEAVTGGAIYLPIEHIDGSFNAKPKPVEAGSR